MSPSVAPTATLVARHLHYERGGHTVLDDVSCSVGPATCLGVVGPNGVGKSTLLQMLAGLLVPMAGEVRVEPPTATVGYLSQEHGQDDETVVAALTRRAGVTAVEEELAAAASGLAAGGSVAEERYAVALERYEATSGRGLRGPPGQRLRAGGASTRRRRTGPCRRLSGGQAGQGGARSHSARPLRPDAPRRADERSRLRRPGAPGGHGDAGAPAAWSSSPTTAPSSSAR